MCVRKYSWNWSICVGILLSRWENEEPPGISDITLNNHDRCYYFLVSRFVWAASREQGEWVAWKKGAATPAVGKSLQTIPVRKGFLIRWFICMHFIIVSIRNILFYVLYLPIEVDGLYFGCMYTTACYGMLANTYWPLLWTIYDKRKHLSVSPCVHVCSVSVAVRTCRQ